MKFYAAISALVASLALGASAVTLPNADTPLFYLVSTSADASLNFLPLRLYGGTSGYSTLEGTAPIGQFYFWQGRLTAVDPAGGPWGYTPNVGAILGPFGCSTYGPLGWSISASSNKCARYTNFQIQSNEENSQLGAKLAFNYVGSFYSCGTGKDVYYKVDAADGPTGCTPIQLYTVPVVV